MHKLNSSLSFTKCVATININQVLLHNEVVHLQSESKHDNEPKRVSKPKRKSLLAIFSYIICKDTVNEDSMPVVPPSCRAAVVAKNEWNNG